MAKRTESAALPPLGALYGQLLRSPGLEGAAVADLLGASAAGPDDLALTTGQFQAGDVERSRKHVAHALLIANAFAQLANAVLTKISLSRHRFSV